MNGLNAPSGPAFTTEACFAEPARHQTWSPKVMGSSPGLGTPRLGSKGYERLMPRARPRSKGKNREELILCRKEMVLGGKKTW